MLLSYCVSVEVRRKSLPLAGHTVLQAVNGICMSCLELCIASQATKPYSHNAVSLQCHYNVRYSVIATCSNSSAVVALICQHVI